MKPFLTLFLLFVLTTGAWGHDHWINNHSLRDPVSGQHCCNERDCEDLTAQGIAVTVTAGGYHIADTGEVVPFGRAINRSPDGHFWRCYFLNTDLGGKPVKKVRCLIVPPPST